MRTNVRMGLLTAAIDHDTGPLPLLKDILGGLLDMFARIVWTFCTSTEYNVDVLIASRLHNSSKSLFCNTHKGMGV